jgi:hypothetical protein
VLISGRLIITFANADTGRSVTLRLGGAGHITLNPDGSTTAVGTGNQVLTLFPTDVPAGPSTTLYSGRVVTSISPTGVFTLIGANGKPPVDLCAVLSA